MCQKYWDICQIVARHPLLRWTSDYYVVNMTNSGESSILDGQAQNHRAKGVMRSFSICITQIKPLENGDYESVLKRSPSTSNNASYKQKNPEIWSEPLSERGNEDGFYVYHTNQTLGKRGLRKCTKAAPLNLK